jgi:hypothetical protein
MESLTGPCPLLSSGKGNEMKNGKSSGKRKEKRPWPTGNVPTAVMFYRRISLRSNVRPVKRNANLWMSLAIFRTVGRQARTRGSGNFFSPPQPGELRRIL